MSTREALLARVEAFIQAHGLSARQFGILAAGDHRFVPRLRSGAGVTLTIIERAESYMAAHEQPAENAGSTSEAA